MAARLRVRTDRTFRGIPLRRSAAHGLASAMVLAALAPGCAKVDAVPYCSQATEAIPAPSDACRARPDAVLREAALAEKIEPLAGSLLVEVRFDDDATVGSVCDHRGDQTSWPERAQLAKRVDEIMALPPGPACLAGTRLEFNRISAREAEVKDLIDDCIRQAGTSGDQNASVSGITLDRELARCLDHDQVQRGELWLHERGKPGSSLYVFVRSRENADRRAAVRACADPSSFDLPVAVASFSNDRVECFAGYGWVPFE